VVFFLLNMVRSEDFDTQAPSHSLKIKDKLSEKEVSYYEMKQL